MGERSGQRPGDKRPPRHYGDKPRKVRRTTVTTAPRLTRKQFAKKWQPYRKPKAKPKPTHTVGRAVKKAGRGKHYDLAGGARGEREAHRRALVAGLFNDPHLGKPADEVIDRASAKVDKRAFKRAAKTKLPKVRERALADIYGHQQKRKTEKELFNAPDDVRKRYGLKPREKDVKLKAAGLSVNLTKIGAKGGRAGIDVLEQTTRPLHAVAAGAREQVKRVKHGQNPIDPSVTKAAIQGLRNKRKDTFSDVLREAGVERALRKPLGKKGAKTATGVFGFAGDVVADPLNLTGLGEASIPLKAGAKAGRIANKTHAKKLAVRAGPKKINTHIPLPQMSDKARDRAARVFGGIRPSTLTEAEHAKLSAADRRHRGFVTTETRRMTRKVLAIKKAGGGAQRRFLPERRVKGGKLQIKPRKRTMPIEASHRITDAIEAKDLSRLSPLERASAQATKHLQEVEIQMRAAAGEKVKRYQPEPDVPGYMHHLHKDTLSEPVKKKIARQEAVAEGRPIARSPHAKPARRTTTAADRMRTDRRSAAEIRAEDPEKLVEDLPTTLLAKTHKGVYSAANTGYRREVTETLGRKYDEAAPITPEEGIYTTEKGKLTEVTNGKPPADSVILKRAVAEHANETVQRREPMKFIDPVTSKIKYVLTVPNPQYWSRNYYGGMYNVYNEGAKGPGLLKAIPAAHRVAHRQSTLAKAEETLGAASSVRTAKGHLDSGALGSPDHPTIRKAEAARKSLRSTEAGQALRDWERGMSSDGGLVERALRGEPDSRLSPGRHQKVSAQLDKAFSPVRDAIRKQYGDTITLYRGQKSGVSGGRAALSWTPNKRLAESYAVGKGSVVARDVPVNDVVAVLPNPDGSPEFIVREGVTRARRAADPFGKPPKPAGTIDLGKGGGKVNIDDFIHEIDHENLTGGGLTSELLGSETRRRSHMQVFEDAPRLAAYIYHRRKGLAPDAAVKRSMNSQFDYGALSKYEDTVARRIFPFYTWRSRNIALQGKTLVARPSKFSHLEALREEMAKQGGFPKDWEKTLTEAQALGIPFPISSKGEKALLMTALPATDLNLFTTDPGAWVQQIGGMTNPLAKVPAEFLFGYSLFFRDQIESDGRHWFSAPDRLIDQLPKPLQDKLVSDGIIAKGTDRWTGKRTWQWRGKADYLAKTIPLVSVALSALTSSKSRQGEKSTEREAGWLTGFRKVPLEPTENRLFTVYDQINKNREAEANMRELGNHKRKSGQWTPAYAKIQKRYGELQTERKKLEKKTGKKVIAWPRKPSTPSGGSSGGGISLGGSSGSGGGGIQLGN